MMQSPDNKAPHDREAACACEMRVRSGVMRFWHKKARTVAGKVCVTAVRVSGFEATAEAIGELVQQLAVHRLAGGEVSANRIEYRGFHFAVRRQFGDDFRRELRLAKEADDFVVGNHLVQFADAFRARRARCRRH